MRVPNAARMLWLAIGVAILAGAGRVSSAVVPIREGGVLRVNVSGPPLKTLDPGVDYSASGNEIYFATCAKLVNYSDRARPGTVVVPEVADALPQVSDGGRTFVFRIRPGFRFETGEAVTAVTFAHVIDRDLAPALRSPATAFLKDVIGARAVVAGSALHATGVTAEGNTLTIRLTKPAPDFLARLAMSFFCAVPQSLPSRRLGVEQIPSAGPYFVASVGGSEVVLKRNHFYGGARTRHLDEIQLRFGTDELTSIRQIEAGTADYEAGELLPTAVHGLASRYGINRSQFFLHPNAELYYLAFNARRPAFRDASMRRAVNFALDRRSILRASGLFGKATDQILTPDIPGYRNAQIYPLGRADVAQARRLLRGRRPTVTLCVSPSPADQQVAFQVIQQLGRVGMQVALSTCEGAFEDLKTKRFDMVLATWTADYLDPYDFVDVLLRTGGADNVGRFSVPAFDARMDAAASLTGVARARAYARLDADLMRRAAPLAPLANIYLPELVSKRVRPGCSAFPPAAGGLDLATACLR